MKTLFTLLALATFSAPAFAGKAQCKLQGKLNGTVVPEQFMMIDLSGRAACDTVDSRTQGQSRVVPGTAVTVNFAYRMACNGKPAGYTYVEAVDVRSDVYVKVGGMLVMESPVLASNLRIPLGTVSLWVACNTVP